MHNSEHVLENEAHKLLWNLKIQVDHLLSARWSYLVKVNKEKRKKKEKGTHRMVDFTVLADHILKLKESEKRDKYLNLARNLKTEYESDSDTNCN